MVSKNLSSLLPFNSPARLEDACSSSVLTELDKPTAYSLVDNETFFGVEVEIENVHKKGSAILQNMWQCKSDGSLRGAGLEYVSYAMRGKRAAAALSALYQHLDSIKATPSVRTSVHVHINMQDQTIEQLRSLVMTYIIFERVLYDFVGNNREKNNFCVPLYSYPPTYDLLRHIGPQGKVSNLSTFWAKYTGLNLKPLTTGFGTVEFRHFSGSRDINKVITWINILLSLKKFASDTTVDKLRLMLKTHSVFSLTSAVFGDMAQLFGEKPLELMIQEGINDLSLMFQAESQHSIRMQENSSMYKRLNSGAY